MSERIVAKPAHFGMAGLDRVFAGGQALTCRGRMTAIAGKAPLRTSIASIAHAARRRGPTPTLLGDPNS